MDTRDREKDLGLGPLQSDPPEGNEVSTGTKAGFKTTFSSQDLAGEKAKAKPKPKPAGDTGPEKG